MASRRASFISLFALSWSGLVPSSSGSLHAGQRLAKPGLSGLSSNSSEQTTQTLMGNAMLFLGYSEREKRCAEKAACRKSRRSAFWLGFELGLAVLQFHGVFHG